MTHVGRGLIRHSINFQLSLAIASCNDGHWRLFSGLESQPDTWGGKDGLGGSVLVVVPSQMFHSFGFMTPPEGLTGSSSVLEPPCSGNLCTQHVTFHISSPLLTLSLRVFQFTQIESGYVTEYKTTWQFSQGKTSHANNMLEKCLCAGESVATWTSWTNFTQQHKENHM